jgi:predicted house-cleaning noncanonical NTP pyrophosphatase (MazG superfamily)
MKKYSKLVRDKIPEIILSSGSIPITRILSDEEYLKALCDKLIEEANEAKDNPVVEELADLLEVIIAVGQYMGYSMSQIEEARIAKKKLRGGFEKRVFLESTDE